MSAAEITPVDFHDVHTRFGSNHVHRGLTFSLAPGEVTTSQWWDLRAFKKNSPRSSLVARENVSG